MLRDYQRKAIDDLYAWFDANPSGHPCLVLPTGAGKSHIVAALCKEALQSWPETRVLMVTHQKELIEQNAAKLRQHWPGAPMGIYSASVGKRQLGEPITFAGIQSLIRRLKDVGHVDLVLVDECFVAGTKIATPSGERDIDNVSCGDVILTQAGHGVVQAVSRRMVSETYIVETDDGRRLECTGNHPFFTEQGWRPAANLVEGSRLFRVQDMLALWEHVSSVDEATRGWDENSPARKRMEKAELLLSEVCKEIEPDSSGRSGTQQDQEKTKRDQASSNQARRERSIASLAAACASSCAGGRLGGRGIHSDESQERERGVSDSVQGGHRKQADDGGDRNRRRKSLVAGKEIPRQEKRFVLGGPRVVSVSRVQRESPVAVFNLHVGGHPSFFANGVAVHNCHLISHEEQGSYRTLLRSLQEKNPHVRIVGLTATPYRLGHGLITDPPALFSDLIEPVSIEELIFKGFLAPLRSKLTKTRMDVTDVTRRGGEYVERELQEAINTDPMNSAVVSEAVELAGDRRSWLFFCAGVAHAERVREELRRRGITAECVTGDTPKAERARILDEYKAGNIRALTNANVLTTGFDAPETDLIAMLRPTLSPSLYVQMAGRGMRPKQHTDHCLVLDFAGVVSTHGPITAVAPGGRRGDGEGEAMIPAKACANCHELVPVATRICPECGTTFPEPEKKALELHDDDIMGIDDVTTVEIKEWRWRKHTSRASGIDMLAVTYYTSVLSDPGITEYFPVLHEGYAGDKAINTVVGIAKSSLGRTPTLMMTHASLDDTAAALQIGRAPSKIAYKRDGKFYRVIARKWTPNEQAIAAG